MVIEELEFLAVNPQIKRPYMESEFTPEMIMDLKKCKDDPIYFIENFVKVQHPVKGVVPMALYGYQKEMLLTIHENRDCVVLASRQSGKCFLDSTSINTAMMPFGIKRAILKIVDRKTYDQLFSKRQAN